jgi:hypothetical protein
MTQFLFNSCNGAFSMLKFTLISINKSPRDFIEYLRSDARRKELIQIIVFQADKAHSYLKSFGVDAFDEKESLIIECLRLMLATKSNFDEAILTCESKVEFKKSTTFILSSLGGDLFTAEALCEYLELMGCANFAQALRDYSNFRIGVVND